MMSETKEKLYQLLDEEVADALTVFELETKHETAVCRISGGFATADIVDWDEEYFSIELKWGVQNDVENRVTTELYKMNRSTLEITPT